MKAVLISIQPKWVEKIANGEKTIEVRKTAPKQVPFKCYIYCTKGTPDKTLLVSKDGNRVIIGDYRNAFNHDVDGNTDWTIGNAMVIGEFICDKIIEWQYDKKHQYYVDYPDDCTSYFPYLKCHSEATGLRCSEIEKFGKGKTLYGWNLSDLKIYDTPKTLVEFYKCGAESFEELFDVDGLCQYCSETDYGEHKYDISSCWGMVSCEGRWRDEAYQQYLDENFAITRAPRNWQYVQEIQE